MVVLDRVVDEPELLPLVAAPEGRLDLAHDIGIAQRRQPRPHAQRDVAGMVRRECVSTRMRDARVLATRSSRVLVPSVQPERKELLLRTPHHHLLQRWLVIVKPERRTDLPGTTRYPRATARRQPTANLVHQKPSVSGSGFRSGSAPAQNWK